MTQQADASEITTGKQWGALIAAAVSIVAAGSCTTLAGLLTTKLSNELDWAPSEISGGVAVNMALYGVAAPFAIFFMQKYGVRRVSTIALCMLGAGCLIATIPNVVLFNVSWGLLVGLGTGSLTMAYGALVARTWFCRNQGTVAGILTASAVVGQFALLPMWAEAAAAFGWRAPLIGCALVAAVALAVNFALMGDEQRLCSHQPVVQAARGRRMTSVLSVLVQAARTQPFWIMIGVFAICGATTNGLMWSHFTPAANDHGITPTAASTVLFMVGVFNIVGTVSAGWLADRISPRLILAFVFLARAATLLWLPLIIQSGFDAELIAFGIMFGILDVATVPAMIALCNRSFGVEGPAIFGWVNGAHQIGAGMMALSGGFIRASYGSYLTMWLLAGGLCAFAAFLTFASRYKRQPEIADAPLPAAAGE